MPKITMKGGSDNDLTSSSRDEESKSKPLYYRKELLKPGMSLLRMEEQGNANLREVLRSKALTGHAVAVGLQVRKLFQLVFITVLVLTDHK